MGCKRLFSEERSYFFLLCSPIYTTILILLFYIQPAPILTEENSKNTIDVCLGGLDCAKLFVWANSKHVIQQKRYEVLLFDLQGKIPSRRLGDQALSLSYFPSAGTLLLWECTIHGVAAVRMHGYIECMSKWTMAVLSQMWIT